MSSKNGRDSFLYSERLQYIRNVAASLLLRRGKLYAGGKPRRQRLGRQAGYDFDNVESDKMGTGILGNAVESSLKKIFLRKK